MDRLGRIWTTEVHSLRFPRADDRMKLLRASVIASVLVFAGVNSASAQHASDNPVTAADDAYGLTLGLESVGLYSPGLVRGFSPQAAGNVRIDGLYFDQQGALSNRVVEGSAIRVGVTEIGYAFPAPTGIVDYDLRHTDGDRSGASIIASGGPYEGRGVSVDGSLHLLGNTLVLPIGASSEVSTQTPYGPAPGYTSNLSSLGMTPKWEPNDRLSVRAIVDWQQTSAARTFPLFFTAGDYLPPHIPESYLGQNWAEGRGATTNLGALVSAKLTDVWSLKTGVFQSRNDAASSYADLYTDIQPDGRSDHLVVGYPDQTASSTSGEVRLTGDFTSGDTHHQVIVMARGRDTDARYGGADEVDEGQATIGIPVQSLEPDFVYSSRTNDHAELWSMGSAYHLAWSHRVELEVGIQRETYHESAATTGASVSEMAVSPFRLYGNAAVAFGGRWTLYGGYTQGLENSGTAPSSASNGGAVLPASRTWQVDAGTRFALTPKVKVILGAFELQKPYFNLDTDNLDRELGVQKAQGLELSVAGEPAPHLNVNIGILSDTVMIFGSSLLAEGVGPIAVGQPRLMYVANVNYALPWKQAVSLDASATHFGTQPESVDNRVYTPAVTQTNIGGRYKFTTFGTTSTLRVQVQNVLGNRWWTSAYTPGFFQWPGPRTLFAYLTTDLR
jgi:iron complex outermembrane recepter protein